MTLNSIDLTQLIGNKMPVYPGDPVPLITQKTTIANQNYRTSEISLGTHTGTHIDAPAHIIPSGMTLDSFPPEKFIGHGQVIDCRQTSIITVDLFKQSLSSKTPDFVLIHTGWDANWGTDAYFQKSPEIDLETAEYLCTLGLKGIGIDAPSFDPVGSEDYSRHKLFLGSTILLIENLTGLQNLLGKQFIFSCFPLKIKNADGSPIRAVAIIQE